MNLASKFKLASFFLNFLFFSSIIAQCPIGNVFLTSQADVDNYMNFYQGCTAIDGAVYLGSFTTTPSDIHDLSGFENLVTIRDGLFISNTKDLKNLDGFNALKDAGKTISLFFNENLTDLNALINVDKTLDELNIVGHPYLHSIEGLANVKLAKNITISENRSLQNLNGLTTFPEIEYVTIQDNAVLNDISNFQWATSIVQLKILDNPALANLNGLQNLVSIDKNLVLSNNPLLSDLSGLNQLITVGQNINILNSPALTSLDGLDNLSQSSQFIIKDNNGLLNIGALNNLTNVGGITLANNPLLNNLVGLSNVNTLARLVVENNDALINLNGLAGLNSVSDYLRISDHLNLENFDGLDNLTSAAGIVEIKDNDALEDLNAIDATNISATTLEISTNPNLSVCNITSLCNYILGGTGSSIIHSNGSDCKSVAEVQSACGLILAVDLTDFEVRQVGELAIVNWETQTEKNNLGFTVQKSTDGIHWNMIGWVAGLGYGAQYIFTDKHPQAGTNYYRLQQTDNDGTINSSDIRQLNFKTMDLTGISIYPNPASDQVAVEIPTTKNIKWDKIRLYDVNGRMQRQWPIKTTQKTYLLNLQGLPSGFYILRIADQKQRLYVDDAF